MPASKRPRGATLNYQEPPGLLGLLFSPRSGWVLLAGGIVLSAGLLMSNPNVDATPQPVALNLTSDISPDLTAIKTDDTVSVSVAMTTEDNVTQIAPAPVPAPELPWVEEVVRKGDNLSLIFNRAGYTNRDVYDVVRQAANGKSLERIFPGQTISFQADAADALAAIRYVKNPLETIVYRRESDGFTSKIETREPQTRVRSATGVIDSSLYLTGQEAGLSQNMIMELANVFGGVIDFVLDPRRGDTIQLIYEELYLDGERFRDGELVAASFTNRGETFNAFRYTDSEGHTSYYNEDGVSMRKAFLMAPVDFTRISSSFNPRRRHPIYKTNRPHRGVDYAASRGTPVFASGDGRVTRAGYTKANGNYIVIAHGEQYVTKYLHLHKRKVKKGQRVTQSQVIGTVGSTGAATGPHLHYEFLMNGVHRNPRTIHKKLPKAKSLPEAELEGFRVAINHASTQLAALRSAEFDNKSTSVAMSGANAKDGSH